MTKRPYYNHDGSWTERAAHNSPVWGHYSPVLYTHVLDVLQKHGIGAHCGLPAEKLLFDAGCGAGQFGSFATAAGFQYTGVDESPAAITLGHKHWPALDLRCVDLAQHTTEVVALAGTFGVVTSLNVYHCFVEPAHRSQYLRNLQRLVTRNGVLLMTTMCGPLALPHRASREPRVYLEPVLIRSELKEAGWTRVMWQQELSADSNNPVPNLEILVGIE